MRRFAIGGHFAGQRFCRSADKSGTLRVYLCQPILHLEFDLVGSIDLLVYLLAR
jgi:hypothetical protein